MSGGSVDSINGDGGRSVEGGSTRSSSSLAR